MEEKIKIDTKLGIIQINSNQIINFIEAPLGYSNFKSYVLLEDKNEDSIFLWLQATNNKDLSFPVLEVELLGYNKQDFISNEVKDKLNLDTSSDFSVYTIVSIPEDPTNMTANLKGPVIINNTTKMAVQTILSNINLEVAKPIFVELSSKLLTANNDTNLNDKNNACKELLF